MISINHIKSYRDVVAVCDLDLLGKKFEEPLDNGSGRVRQLDVKENFYTGEQVSQEKAIELLKRFSREDSTFNIVGSHSIAAALKAEVIIEEQVGHIAGIPFALVFL